MTVITSAEDTERIKRPFTILALDYVGGFEGNGTEFTELYKIVFDDHQWTTVDLFNYSEFPRKWQRAKDPELYKKGYYVKQVNWKRDVDAPQICNLEVTLSNIQENSGQYRNKDIEYEPNPVKRPPIFTFNTYTTREIQDLAYEKLTSQSREVPIQTTALEPILYTEERKRRQIVVEFNVDYLPDIVFNEYEIVNQFPIKIPRSNSLSNKFATYPPETLKLHELNVTTETIENEYRYFKITAVIQHRSETWRFKPRNVGRQSYPIIAVKNPLTDELEAKKASAPTLIKIGNPPELPLSPLPLRNTPNHLPTHGVLFKDYINYDEDTGEFLPNQDPISPARLREIFKEATLNFIVYPAVDFAKYIPGLGYYN